MSNVSTFESRAGKLTCSADTFYKFITDIRNFSRLIPQGTAGNLVIGKETCTFSTGMLGSVKIRISEKNPYEKVTFSGNASQINDFQIIVYITGSGESSSGVKIMLLAELNHLLKMFAAEPIKRLLGNLVDEMEKFNGWNDVREHI